MCLPCHPQFTPLSWGQLSDSDHKPCCSGSKTTSVLLGGIQATLPFLARAQVCLRGEGKLAVLVACHTVGCTIPTASSAHIHVMFVRRGLSHRPPGDAQEQRPLSARDRGIGPALRLDLQAAQSKLCPHGVDGLAAQLQRYARWGLLYTPSLPSCSCEVVVEAA